MLLNINRWNTSLKMTHTGHKQNYSGTNITLAPSIVRRTVCPQVTFDIMTHPLQPGCGIRGYGPVWHPAAAWPDQEVRGWLRNQGFCCSTRQIVAGYYALLHLHVCLTSWCSLILTLNIEDEMQSESLQTSRFVFKDDIWNLKQFERKGHLPVGSDRFQETRQKCCACHLQTSDR